jgi:farnesol dehydrogenase
MNILVTGATGYVGSRVAVRLAEIGHTVRVLVRPGREAGAPPGCRVVVGELRDPAALRRALAGCEGLVHMAALVRRWCRDAREFDRVNVEGLSWVLRAAGEIGVPRIVYTSSIVALGPSDGTVRDETIDRTDFGFHTDYERSKWVADRLVREKAAAGLPVVSVYPGVIYGPGAATEGNLLGPSLAGFLAGRLPARLGRGDLRICYAFIEDVAEGHRLALEKGAPGGRYILGGENATQDHLFTLLEEITGLRGPRRAVPYWVAEALGSALELAARLTGLPPRMTRGAVATFRHEWAFSSALAERELGYRITPLREGLRRTLETLRAGSIGGAAPGGGGPATTGRRR